MNDAIPHDCATLIVLVAVAAFLLGFIVATYTSFRANERIRKEMEK